MVADERTPPVAPDRLPVGREPELELLEGLIDALPGRGSALVVRGDAGIGKSALLDVLGRSAARRGFAVLGTTGVQSETHLPFAGLHQLLRPLLGALGRLPARQREAVEAAFGMSTSVAPDTFLIGLGCLELIADAASDSAVILVVDDAHWLDSATCDVLAFVARRVELDPILVVFATRAGLDSRILDAGLPTLEVGALADEAAAELLETSAPGLDADIRRRVLGEAAGNPLALIELPRGLHTKAIDDPALPVPLPLTERLERAFTLRLTDLPTPARHALLVAALDQNGGLSRVLAAISLLQGSGVGVAVFTEAVDANLVGVDRSRIEFRHPLIRSAVYHDAQPADRVAAHAALAEAYADDPDRAVWHRAASLVRPDEKVVVELEEAAARAQRKGAPAGAAAALLRAAELTTDVQRRGRLLVRAAELEYEVGRHPAALRVLREARALELDVPTRVRVAFLVEIMESSWTGAEKIPGFVDLAEQLRDAGDTEQALAALATVALRCWYANPGQSTRDRVVAMTEGLGLPSSEPTRLTILANVDPVNQGRVVLDGILAAREPDPTDPHAMLLLGAAATSVWAHNLALPFHAAAVEGLRAQGRAALLAQGLVSLAWVALFLADARIATPAAEEGTRLAEETGQPRWAATALLARAAIAAERGNGAFAAELTSRAEGVLLPMGANPLLSVVQFVRGRAAIAEARFSDAYEHLRAIYDPADALYHPNIGAWSIADFVDAAVHGGGDLEVAHAAFAEYERMAELSGGPLLCAQITYARPTLAPDDEPGSLYQAALEDPGLANFRCYRGRLLLAYGAWLRRQRRVAESRVPLRAAAQTFDALGFVGMSERARNELRASGETSRPRVPEGWDELSPQELQIARMAAEGLTNREIGERLYLSHRTIGSHLYRIFPKLGIASRAQLRDALGGASLPA